MIDLITKISPNLKQNKLLSPIIAFNQSLIAFIIDQINIELFEYNRKDKKSIRLNGHRESIKCCKFSLDNTLLCTVSTDLIIIWNLNEITQLKTHKGKIIGKQLAHEPTSCALHPNNTLVAITNSEYLTLFNIDKSLILNQIKFDYYLNTIEFSLFDTNLILITNQTNTLFVYNIESYDLEHTIQNVSNTTFISVCSLSNQRLIVTSSSNFTLNIYEYKQNQSILINKINLETLYIEKTNNHDTNGSLLCIGLQVFNLGVNSRIEFNQSRKSLTHVIVCATPICLFFIDLTTGNLIYLVDFNDVSFRKSINNQCYLMPQCVDFSLIENKQINAALLYLFQNEINIVKCAEIICSSKESLNLTQINDFKPILSVFPKESSLLKESPLNEEIKETIVKKVPSLHEYMRKTSSIRKNKPTNNGLDRPLTFNSKIKSSGYNQAQAVREKFTPLINKSNRSLSLSNLKLPDKNNKVVNKEKCSKLDFNFELPMVLDKKINASDKSSPIVLMKYSCDGANLCFSSADNIVQYLSVKNLEKPGIVFNTHKETIRSIDISHDCKLLLTASDDKSCKLWSVKKTNDLLIDIQSVKTSDNKVLEFKKEIVSGNFFYLDKFILIGTENKFLLCKYFIDSNRNDVQRYLNGSNCKLVKQIELSSAQSITCLSAINSFYSYLVITAGSDKSIEIFDMNECKSSLFIPEAHIRNIHQIYQNESVYNQQSYDLFLTNAITDGVKLWDLRIAECVNKFDYHLNRCLPIKVSFSPDSNYIVAGAEDRSALIYDLRMSGLIQKYGVFSDTVSNSQFNPQKSQLICSTQDGKLYTYKTK